MMPYTIRRAQLISPFGVGSMQVFEDGSSLMVGGLDAWDPGGEHLNEIHDKRLEARLRVTHFRLPPEKGIPLFRFPQWHYCIRCRMMTKRSLTKISTPICKSSRQIGPKSPCTKLPKYRRDTLQQMRFVLACPSGHIEDFPWVEWLGARVHSSKVKRGLKCCDNPQLRFTTARRTGLSDIIIKCINCGTSRSLAGANAPGVFEEYGCRGYQPWFNGEIESCDNEMQLVQRGASNTYFPRTVSSILIPPFSGRVADIIENDSTAKSLLESADGDLKKQIIQDLAKRHNLSYSAISSYLDSMNEERSYEDSEEAYRLSEYKALSVPDGRSDRLFVTCPQSTASYADHVTNFIDRVVLVEKLAETRAMTGFTRIQPTQASDSNTARLSLRSLDWQPANRVYGEGVFLTLNPAKLAIWADRPDVQHRAATLRKNYHNSYHSDARSTIEVTPVFLLLHSLAHLLIRELIFECGYGSAALRERLYCGTTDTESMAGILIYTASGDSEGSMGGLVAQGTRERLSSTLRKALISSVHCSSDPVCRESQGQGSSGLNLAACHACMLLPETSCEMGNVLLDRMLLTGSPSNPSIGLWGESVTRWLENTDQT